MGQLARGVGGGATEVTVNETVADLGVINITEFPYNASPGGDPATNHQAIMDALDAAQSASGGVIYTPGGADSIFQFDDEIRIPEASNIVLWAPGGAQWMPSEAIPVPVAIGDIDTLATDEENFLDSDAAAGDRVITLAAGKGANFAVGGHYIIRSTAIIPGHHAAVVVNAAEHVTVYDKDGDELTFERPLRYSYATADDAELYRPPWIENFKIIGLGLNGNDQIGTAVMLLMSWCLGPEVKGMRIANAQQRGIRLQGSLDAMVSNYRQSNGLSSGFDGDVGHFSYALSEGGPCEGSQFQRLFIDRCRHGYTTSGMVANGGTSSPLNTPGFGVPSYSLIADGIHRNAKGAGWDTHETGLGIWFRNIQTLGSRQIGFQNRSVDTKLDEFYASDCIGAPMQNGADAQNFQLGRWDFDRCNLGTDDTGVDWTKMSELCDNSTRMYSFPAKSVIDNGNFDIWERESTFTATGPVANRWAMTLGTGAAATLTRQNTSFTPPTTTQSGRYFCRLTRGTTGSTPTLLFRHDEVMRQTAGNRIWVSFDMRSDTGTLIDVYCTQYFGSGGAPSASVVTATKTRTIDEAFRRYHVYFDLPTIEGKTIGSDDNASLITTFSLPTSEGTCFIDIKRVAISIGRVPGEFQLPIVAEESDKCRRYYEKCMRENIYPGAGTTSGSVRLFGTVSNKNAFQQNVHFTTRKAAVPTIVMRSTDTGVAAKVYNDVQDLDIDAQATRVGPAGFTGGILTSGDVDPDDVCSFLWEAYVPNFQ